MFLEPFKILLHTLGIVFRKFELEEKSLTFILYQYTALCIWLLIQNQIKTWTKLGSGTI